MLMNYYRNIDRTWLQFDFLTHRPYRSDYDDEIEKMGGKLFYAPRLYPWNYPNYFRWMNKFFEEHSEYKIVHSHIDSMSYLPLLAAKKAGVPVRIAHSHNTSIDLDWKYLLKYYYRSQIPKVATYYCACGEMAGKFLFPNRSFQVICNAIDMNKFTYSSKIRDEVRKSLNIENSFVIGHVGRFSTQKNHERILKIFLSVLMKKKEAVLLLIGEGEKEEHVVNLVKKYGIFNKVLFLGKRHDVDKLYQAMDILLMPSLFEGIPVVGIEAQSTGLPCFFSNKVPNEVKMSDNCYFISLEEKDNVWADAIVNYSFDAKKRTGVCEKNRNSKYNISSAVTTLTNLYENLLQT